MSSPLFSSEVSQINVRVAAGITWLTEHYGDAFFLEIVASRIDQNSSCVCVIGQLIGTYSICYFALRHRDQEAIEHGFLVNAQLYETDEAHKYYRLLSTAWRKEIVRLQHQHMISEKAA